MVLFGAITIGSMATVWYGRANPKRANKTSEWTYADQDIVLEKGEDGGFLHRGPAARACRWKPTTVPYEYLASR